MYMCIDVCMHAQTFMIWFSSILYLPPSQPWGSWRPLGTGVHLYILYAWGFGSLSLYALSLLLAYVRIYSYVVMLCLSIWSHIVSFPFFQDSCSLTDFHCSTFALSQNKSVTHTHAFSWLCSLVVVVFDVCICLSGWDTLYFPSFTSHPFVLVYASCLLILALLSFIIIISELV